MKETGTKENACILSRQRIKDLIASGCIKTQGKIKHSNLQPASLDLTIGRRAWRVRSGFLSEESTVLEKLEHLSLFELDLGKGAVLEKGHPYILELQESLDLPADTRAKCNPRSSAGRVDIFTRVVADKSPKFDEIRSGYKGNLYLEVVPRSFTIKVKTGISLAQIRFIEGDPMLSDRELVKEARTNHLVFSRGKDPVPFEKLIFDNGLVLRVSLLSRSKGKGIIGYKAKQFSGLLDLSKEKAHKASDFFEPIHSVSKGFMVLEPEVFYILSSLETIFVPPHLSAEMVPFEAGLGELRTNYAGFFDNGFGPAKAVLEVRAHDVPFLIEHGQALFKMKYYRTSEVPEKLYGEKGLRSHYQSQGLSLSRHFK